MIDSDWIELVVKFRGKCPDCGKAIKPGERAFWSKSSKSIKHVNCYYEYLKKFGTSTKPDPSIKNECILCKSSKFLLNEMGYENSDNLQQDPYIICHTCIQDPNCYNRYQQIILEKIKKIVRLKSL